MTNLGFVNFVTYFFLLFTVIMAGMTVKKKHPVHAVLCLIGTFCCGSGLLLINNAEFLAFMVLTVYVGAVMILFLFVVIMIDIQSIKYTKKYLVREFTRPNNFSIPVYVSLFQYKF